MNRLREFRLAAGMTQEALAKRAGISSRTILAIERNYQGDCQQNTKRLILKALKVPWQDKGEVWPE